MARFYFNQMQVSDYKSGQTTEGKTMNEEITNTNAEAQPAIAAAVLTDAEVEALLARKPVYVAEPEAEEEPVFN